MTEVQQEAKSVIPPGSQSNVQSEVGSPRDNPSQKMGSTGNEDLFKSGVIGVIDNKNVTGNKDLFKSGFAKSEVDSNRKSLQQKSQRSKAGDSKSKGKSNTSRSKKSVDDASPEVSAERSIGRHRSEFKTMSNFNRDSSLSHNRRSAAKDPRDMSPAERVVAIKPLRANIKIPNSRFNYALDNEEKEIIHMGKDLSKQEVWTLLEKKRFAELKKASI